jgi:hypothetical protein
MKTCVKCKIERELQKFSKNRNYCKICQSEYNKLFYSKNREKEKSRRKKYYVENRDEELEKLRNKRKNQPEKYQKIDKISNIKRREYLLDYNKKYREDNKEYFKRKRIEWKEKNTNELYKFYNSIRLRILKSIKRGFKKTSRTKEILGCSYEEFRVHIESKFLPWMNWKNRGLYNGEFNYGWDIDHIIPISSANCEEDIIKLNHYTNLQPLCSKINRDVKKNKLDWKNQGTFWHKDNISISSDITVEDVYRLNHYTNFQHLCCEDNLKKLIKYNEI